MITIHILGMKITLEKVKRTWNLEAISNQERLLKQKEEERNRLYSYMMNRLW